MQGIGLCYPSRVECGLLFPAYFFEAELGLFEEGAAFFDQCGTALIEGERCFEREVVLFELGCDGFDIAEHRFEGWFFGHDWCSVVCAGRTPSANWMPIDVPVGVPRAERMSAPSAVRTIA